jgi:hypothetical protein
VEILGGDRPESNASASATPPQQSPDQHKHDEQPCGGRHDPALACWKCRDARKTNRDADDQAVLAEATRRGTEARRREQCPACDVNGWLEHPDTGVPVARCDHKTDPRQQLADALDHVS